MTMRDDIMSEALELGFLADDAKKTSSITFKVTHETQLAIDALAGMDDVSRSEWVLKAVIEKIIELKRQYDFLQKAFGHTTNTADTQNSTQQKAPHA
jgi:uncharacterized protein (DUF1778 family)